MSASSISCHLCGVTNSAQATHCVSCHHALHPLSLLFPLSPSNATLGPLAPSTLLHQRYSIEGQVGTGGFGAVYKGRDTLFSNRPVAIKEMNQSGLSPQKLAEASASFHHEALLLAGLAHPNLPRIHDLFSEHGRSYIVMDFIDGETLEDYLGKIATCLPVEEALDIGLQLCSVLDYLHTRPPPLIFRDLKPANVMRTAGGQVYLIDFGIARHFKPGKP